MGCSLVQPLWLQKPVNLYCFWWVAAKFDLPWWCFKNLSLPFIFLHGPQTRPTISHLKQMSSLRRCMPPTGLPCAFTFLPRWTDEPTGLSLPNPRANQSAARTAAEQPCLSWLESGCWPRCISWNPGQVTLQRSVSRAALCPKSHFSKSLDFFFWLYWEQDFRGFLNVVNYKVSAGNQENLRHQGSLPLTPESLACVQKVQAL